MKLVSLFNEFLKDEVNLDAGRVASLEISINAIKNYIEASDWEPEIIEWQPQGSWAHKTIIKPVDKGEFDADLLVFIEPVKEWSAKDYINNLYSAFRDSAIYRTKVQRFSHCVTITYANDKKIDVAPIIVDRFGFPQTEVCNRNTDSFEPSEPKLYTAWLIERNGWTGSNSFRKATRLIKYLRDIKTTFTCTSVLLTTMLGYRINSADKDGTEFTDTPTALKTIFGRWDDWLTANPVKPSVVNPFLTSENFAESLTDNQYANLRDMVAKYRGWIDDAYAEEDRGESISKWRRVFGDEFAKDVVAEEAKSVSRSAAILVKETAGALADAGTDLVSLVRRMGARALPGNFNRLPHMRQPKWRVLNTSSINITIRTELYASRGFNKIRDVLSLEPVPKGNWLKFIAYGPTGIPLNSSDFDVKWRVTNTDLAAAEARCLRGRFEDSSTRGERWEELAYRGVHIVEAFVLRRRDNTQIGKSEPFYVTIE